MPSVSSTRKIILLRHGETDWNQEGRFQGQQGPGLNARGYAQAEAAGHALKDLNISQIYCSDQLRAVMTAEVVAVICAVKIVEDSCWREINLGEWEGQLGATIQQNYSEQWQERLLNPATFKSPQGESLEDVRRRVLQGISAILKTPQVGTVLIVSHAITLAVIRVLIEGSPLEYAYGESLKNGEIYELVLDDKIGLAG